MNTENLTVKFKIKGEKTVYTAEVINISAGGICLLRSTILDSGDIIHIRFPFESKKLLLTAKVCRIEGREVGIEFIDDDAIIEKFISLFNDEYPQLNKKEDRIFSEKVKESVEDLDEDLEDLF